MFERFTPVNQCIKHSFIVSIKGFSDDSYEFLQNAPDTNSNENLDDTLRCFMEKASDDLINRESIDNTQNFVLKHCNRDAGNLGGKVPGLQFYEPEQTFGFFEWFYFPAFLGEQCYLSEKLIYWPVITVFIIPV
jgi:hypothetical protein